MSRSGQFCPDTSDRRFPGGPPTPPTPTLNPSKIQPEINLQKKMPKRAQNDPIWHPQGAQNRQKHHKNAEMRSEIYERTRLRKNGNRIPLDLKICVFVQEGSQKSLIPPAPKKVPKGVAKGAQNGAFGRKNRDRSLSERCSKNVSEKIRKLVAMGSKKAPKRALLFRVGDVFWPPFSALEACRAQRRKFTRCSTHFYEF